MIRTGYELLDLEVVAIMLGRCDSFVLKTDVHFLKDINLLSGAIRVLIRECVHRREDDTLTDWRQHQNNLCQFRTLYREIQKLRHSTSKNEHKKQAQEAKICPVHQDCIDLAQTYFDRVTDSISRMQNMIQVYEACRQQGMIPGHI